MEEAVRWQGAYFGGKGKMRIDFIGIENIM
jgi:hypothetical protein